MNEPNYVADATHTTRELLSRDWRARDGASRPSANGVTYVDGSLGEDGQSHG